MIDVQLFLDVIQQYSFLYDKNRRDYKDTTKKNNAWGEIAGILQCDVEAVKTRWRTLRERFIKETKQSAPRSGQGASEYCSTWEWFSAMQFLKNHVKPRQTEQSAIYCKESLSTSQVEEHDITSETSGSVEDTDRNSSHCSQSSSGSSPVMDEGRHVDTPRQQLPLLKNKDHRAKKRSDTHDVDDAILKRLKTVEAAENNEDNIFGKMVALELQKIADPREKMIRKIKILEIASGLQPI